MNAITELIVDESGAGNRIDRWLSARLPDCSRSRIQVLLDQGQVQVNGNRCTRRSTPLETGDRVCVVVPPPTPSTVEPQNLPLAILYQDEDLVVVNKQAGLSVHPTTSQLSDTLVNALLYHIRDLSGIGGELRPGIVHRLDRVTSGVLLVAKHDRAHRQLSQQFRDRHTQKVYWAIVHGSPTPETGEINQPVARHSQDRKRFTVHPDGRHALTRYRVVRKGLGGAFMELYPVTGRTHQLRVHCRHLGHPIVGDRTYELKRTRDRGSLERRLVSYEGIALHARSLTFTHPESGRVMTVTADAPGCIQEMIDEMT